MISILHYLYRKSGKWATAGPVAILLLSTFVAAQIRDRTEHQPADRDQQQAQKHDKKNKSGPRAIAVVEFLPGGGTRLVPIALWIDGHFYDASLYGANPEPMALQPETLYQALTCGEPAGWFTVTTSRDVNGNWVAEGQWKPETPVEARLAQQAAKQPKPKTKGQDVLSDDQGPPVLRRPGSGDKSSPSGGQSSAPASTSGGNSTPSGSGSSTANSNAPPKSDDDSDRPTLKASPASSSSAPSNSKPTLGDNTQQAKAQAPASNTPSAASPDEDDPNRPVLRRGKPAEQPALPDTADSNASANKAGSPAAGGIATSTPGTSAKATQAPRAYAAISDAGDYQTRSLLYGMASGERQSLGEPMSRMAMDEVRKYASKHNGPALPKTAAITDYDLRGFDLDYSNSPTLVLSAKLPVAPVKTTPGAGFDYFVTVVARVDLNGAPQQIFSMVTDRNHLDAFPRMQLIDAIDADANGRGDLLFRQYSDTGISYALYRVFPYQMEKIFEGGAGM
ncbi:MAG: hypothetical protein ABSC64_17400 [Candidatus Korobacteraceae bacterium]